MIAVAGEHLPGDIEDQLLALGTRHPARPSLAGGRWVLEMRLRADKVLGNVARRILPASRGMPEKGAPPNVHPIQRRVLKALGALSTPLLPDDYLEMINPLWSTRELRGRVEEVRRETENAATVLIKPGYRWPGHKPGQYLRIGVDIDGVRHWRAYSLTSDPYREDGLISVTVKNVDAGKVSPFLVTHAKPGTIVGLGGVEGDFVLPEDPPEKLLFISAGSGDHADHEHDPPPRALRRAHATRSCCTPLGTPTTSSSGPSCASSSAPRRLHACTSSSRATPAAWGPPTSTGCARTGASA